MSHELLEALGIAEEDDAMVICLFDVNSLYFFVEVRSFSRNINPTVR